MSSRLSRLCCVLTLTSLGFLGMSSLSAQQAHAGALIGLDLNGGFNIGELSADGLGLGANLRAGYELGIPLIRLAPEVQLNYMGFAVESVDQSDAVGTASSAKLRAFSGRAGLRAGYSGLLAGAALYTHVGYGIAMTAAQGLDTTRQKGVSADVGLAVDFTLLPFINLGLHGGLNILKDPNLDDPLRWIETGVHAEVVF